MLRRILKLMCEEIMIVNILVVFVLNIPILPKITSFFMSNQSIFQTLSLTSVLNVIRFVILGKHFKYIKVEIINMIKFYFHLIKNKN